MRSSTWFPAPPVGYAGVEREEETALPVEYYKKFPDLSGRTVLVLEPMLATGGSLCWAVEESKAAGADDITALCVVAAPEGMARMEETHPDVRVVTAALDSRLNDRYFIVPGLGDMGRPAVRDAVTDRSNGETGRHIHHPPPPASRSGCTRRWGAWRPARWPPTGR